MKNKRPDQADQKQKLRVLFDSGCGATLINKNFVRHWKKTESKSTKCGLPKVVASKQRGSVKSNSLYLHSMRAEKSHAVHM
jgi:hypothetical protein